MSRGNGILRNTMEAIADNVLTFHDNPEDVFVSANTITVKGSLMSDSAISGAPHRARLVVVVQIHGSLVGYP